MKRSLFSPSGAVALLLLVALSCLGGRLLAVGQEEPIDQTKLRALYQRSQHGQTLTPEEQAYLERGKAERQKPQGRSAKQAAVSASTSVGKTSVGLVPLTDMSATEKYQGEDGGLYGGGRNTPPDAHLKAAQQIASSLKPLDAAGKPSSSGKLVLLTHGMSNTTMESQRFIELAQAEPRLNPALLLIDGAQGGIDSRKWLEAAKKSGDEGPWKVLQQRIHSAGATPAQVQVVWMKHAIIQPANYGVFPKSAQQLKNDWAELIHQLKQRFPNLKLAYLSSRAYAGYAENTLNPEPFAYESAFAVRWLIEDQIKGEPSLSYANGKAPLLLWGPYLWADGEKGRRFDDLAYTRADFREDGVHPSQPEGRQKIGSLLLKFFSTDPTTASWFLQH